MTNREFTMELLNLGFYDEKTVKHNLAGNKDYGIPKNRLKGKDRNATLGNIRLDYCLVCGDGWFKVYVDEKLVFGTTGKDSETKESNINKLKEIIKQ